MATTIQSQTIKVKSVKTLKDVKTFFRQMNKLYGLTWDPDHDFKDYEMEEKDRKNIQYLVNECWNVCENLNIDIYAIAMKVNYPIRKIYGLGTDKIQN